MDETRLPTKVQCSYNTFFLPGDTREHQAPLTPGQVYDVIPSSIVHPRHLLIRNDNGQELRYDHDRFTVVETD